MIPKYNIERFKDYPDEVVEFLVKIVETKENSDNFRIAGIDNPEQLEAYAKALRRGCCGYHDTVFVDRYGCMYLIGFNYGH